MNGNSAESKVMTVKVTREKKLWVKPQLKSISAGSAEKNRPPDARADGQASQKS